MEIRCKECNELLCEIDVMETDFEKIKEEWYVEHQDREIVILVSGHIKCKESNKNEPNI